MGEGSFFVRFAQISLYRKVFSETMQEETLNLQCLARSVGACERSERNRPGAQNLGRIIQKNLVDHS